MSPGNIPHIQPIHSKIKCYQLKAPQPHHPPRTKPEKFLNSCNHGCNHQTPISPLSIILSPPEHCHCSSCRPILSQRPCIPSYFLRHLPRRHLDQLNAPVMSAKLQRLLRRHLLRTPLLVNFVALKMVVVSSLQGSACVF